MVHLHLNIIKTCKISYLLYTFLLQQVPYFIGLYVNGGVVGGGGCMAILLHTIVSRICAHTYRSRIYERTITLKTLGIKGFRLEVSVWIY